MLQKQLNKDEVAQDGLPLPRVLVGPRRTDAAYSEPSSETETLYKLNNDDDKKQSCLHFTLEYCDKASSLRFARTYFLTPLASDEGYLKGCSFTTDAEDAKPCL